MALVRLWTALILVAASTTLAACGAEDLSPETIANAAKTTSETGGSRVEMNVAMSTPDGQDLEMTGHGVMDMAGQRGRITVDLSELPGGEGELEEVFDGFVIWMRMPAFESELPEGKEWIRIDLQKATKELGVDISQFPQAGSDPTKALEYMRAAGDVEELGEEDVRGAATTRYSATVDVREYPELLPKAERAEARESIENLIELTGEPEFASEVWIDDNDLVRRMRMDIPMTIPNAGRIEMVIDYELYDFGINVDVEPPPDEDVVDYTDIAAEAAQLQQAR